MKRLATWAFYAVGAIAIGYLALYAYAMFTGRDLQPGDPVRIFRKPDAPSYSVVSTSYVDGPYWQALFDVLNELVCFGHMSGLLVRVYDRWP